MQKIFFLKHHTCHECFFLLLFVLCVRVEFLIKDCHRTTGLLLFIVPPTNISINTGLKIHQPTVCFCHIYEGYIQILTIFNMGHSEAMSNYEKNLIRIYRARGILPCLTLLS